MLFTTLFVSALATTGVSAAKPVQKFNKIRQNCQTVPTTPSNFYVAQILPSNITTQTLTANVGPTGTGPCTLIADFPAGFPVVQKGNYNQLNVFALDNDPQGYLAGTVTLNVSPNEPFKATINSFACRDVFTFRFELASEEHNGHVSFTQSESGGIFLQVGDCY